MLYDRIYRMDVIAFANFVGAGASGFVGNLYLPAGFSSKPIDAARGSPQYSTASSEDHAQGHRQVCFPGDFRAKSLFTQTPAPS